jgi:hypothetical protein
LISSNIDPTPPSGMPTGNQPLASVPTRFKAEGRGKPVGFSTEDLVVACSLNAILSIKSHGDGEKPQSRSYAIPAIGKHRRKKRLLDTLNRGASQQISSNEKQRCPK